MSFNGRYFGDDSDTWAPPDYNTQAPYVSSNSTVNETDPTTGTVSNVPYYLANSTPTGAPGDPNTWGPPAVDYSSGAGTASQNGQSVPQPGAPASSTGSSVLAFIGAVGKALTGAGGAPKPAVAVAAPSMIPWIVGGVVALGVVGLLVFKGGKRSSVAGYRRRNRRSRR